ncbi:hypothetical protein GO730_20965 [Spirosoma sp. HMF3257]|uniref:Uncharacterized protein n=1 Tax=Spirosoma telluris TaxID=2183553 RepID=A0A327NKW6_9BACT|nr:hypothetical protein [Spirosoma telluris]RAI76020.1 hypothetical protein HMF3257_20890 [Spirosoma telluris]
MHGEQIQRLLPLQLIDLDEAQPIGAGRLKDIALKELLPLPADVWVDLTTEQRWNLGRLTRWVWKERVTKKPFDSFTVDSGKGKPMTYLLPDDNFSNTTAIEIAMANIHYLGFTRPEKPNQKAVLSLIATLCRPERKDVKQFRQSVDWNGDQREEYNTILADERAGTFDKLPIGTVMAITQYFEAMNKGFLQSYKDVYEPDPNADEEAPLYKNGEGLITTLMDVAKTGTFGDFDKVCKQNGHTIWLYLRDNNLKVRRANDKAEKDRLAQE